MKSMLFIYPDFGGSSLDFSPAIEILSAVLEEAGVKVELLHLHETLATPLDIDIIYDKIKDKHYDVIGVTSTTYQYQISNSLIGQLKDRKVNSLFILGGIHATISSEDLVTSNFDAFSIGEGEISLVELFRRIENGEDIYSTPGFHFKVNNKIIKNPNSKVVQNLDDLPFRNFEIMDTKKLLQLRNNWLSIAFSRGCTYSCNFCINQKLRAIFKENNSFGYFRCQSVDRAMDELLHVVEQYKEYIKVINLDDDLLMVNKKWFLEFARRYKEEIYIPYGIKYAVNGRANLITEELVLVLKESGCELVRVGFETGNEEMRNMILAKEITNQQLEFAFSLFNKYKIRSQAFSMIGIPNESVESIQDSISMLQKLKPTLIRLSVFEPFIGTPMYYYCVEHDLLLDNKIAVNSFSYSNIRFENLDSDDLIRYELMFPWYMNIKMVEKYSEKYKELIEKYRAVTINKDEIFDLKKEILKDDSLISEVLDKEKISHYRYFQNNNFYFQLCQY